jgi:hypothetical protein
MTRRFVPWMIFAIFVAYVAMSAFRSRAASPQGFDLQQFGRLPVAVGGRVQPIDSVGRIGLLQIRGTTNVPLENVAVRFQLRDRALDPTEWLLEVLAKPDIADTRRIFPIQDLTLLSKLRMPASGAGLRYYTFRELKPRLEDIGKETQRIGKIKAADRAPWERDLVLLRTRLVTYERLKNSLQPNSFLQQEAKGAPLVYDLAESLAKYRLNLAEGAQVAIRRQHGSSEQLDTKKEAEMVAFARPFQGVSRVGVLAMIPPLSPADSRDHWHNIGSLIVDSARTGTLPLPVAYVGAITSAYALGKPVIFDVQVDKYQQWLLSNSLGREVSKARYEFVYNHLQPYVRAVALYVVALLLVATSWRRHSKTLYRAGVLVALLAIGLHTAGLMFDMMLTGNPPLTNRFSSLIFSGWTVVLLALAYERFSRSGRGIAMASGIGLAALSAAHGLALGGAWLLLTSVLDASFAVALMATVLVLQLGRVSALKTSAAAEMVPA